MRFARQSSTQVDLTYNNYITQDLFHAFRNLSEERQLSIRVHNSLPTPQEDSLNRQTTGAIVANMPSRHPETSQDFPIYSGSDLSFHSGLGPLNDSEASIYSEWPASGAFNGLPCTTGPQSLHSTNQSTSIQCPPPMQWQSSNHQQWAQTSQLNSSPNVDLQQIQPQSVAMRRSASSTTNLSARRMCTASPYQQLGQRFHPGPHFSSRSASPSPFAGSSSYDDLGTINNPLDVEVATPEDETSGAPAYNKLIYECLRTAPNCEMQLKDIYEWFRENTEKRWAANEKGWQNSIRHNLSMNVAFQKGSRSDPENPKKTMWCLTDEAIEHGILPTTRYRKNNDRQSNRNRLLASPAPQRQLSGARGGNAARRSQRLKMQEAVASRIARQFSSPQTRPQSRAWTAASTPAMTPALKVTYPSPTTASLPSYSLDESYENTGLRPPYFTQSATSTPLLTNNYINGITSTHNFEHSFLPLDTDSQSLQHHSDPTLFAAPDSSLSLCQTQSEPQYFSNSYDNSMAGPATGAAIQPWNHNYFSYYPQEPTNIHQETNAMSTSLPNTYTQPSAPFTPNHHALASPSQLPSQLAMMNNQRWDTPQLEGLRSDGCFVSSDDEQDEPKTPASAVEMKWEGSLAFGMEDDVPADR